MLYLKIALSAYHYGANACMLMLTVASEFRHLQKNFEAYNETLFFY